MKFGRVVEELLPEEVITEILSWVPVKPLLRFRCVCKFWKTLISNPHFVKLHLQRSPKNVNLILTLYKDSYDSVMSCSKDILIHNSDVDALHDRLPLDCNGSVLGSCNGLVCLHTGRLLQKYSVRFWNPEMRLKSKDSPCLHLGSNEYIRSGFGYDKSSDTYKVVVVINDMLDDSKKKVKVYIMGGSYWRDIQIFTDFPIIYSKGKFLNGTLNWLATLYSASSGRSKQLVILSLDLEKETYKQMLLPDALDHVQPLNTQIGVFGDCLYLFHDYYKRTHLSVWQMKEFGVEKFWTQNVNVSYEHLQTAGRFLLPLYISENGDVMLLNYHMEIILYNKRSNRVELATNRKRVWDAKDHVQSLILPC